VTTTVVQAYRFSLDPTPGQDAVLRSHCGGQRYAVNWGPALVTAVMDQRKVQASYGTPAAELTPSPKVRFPRFTGTRHGLSCRFTIGAVGLVER
jgi:hypothetical protein